MKKISLTSWIFISLVTGLLAGLAIHHALPADSSLGMFLKEKVFTTGAAIFIRTLKMLVVPLVFVSMVCGTSSLGDPKKLSRVGGRTILLYLCTTALAISLALIVANLAGVGVGSNIDAASEFKGKVGKPLHEVLINIFPSNPIRSMADGTMLQVIFFAGLFGLSLTLVGSTAKPVTDFFHATNSVIMKMVSILMAFAPIGVFCVVAKVFADKGIDPIMGLFKYFIVMLIILLTHATFVYGGLLKLLSGLSPLRFFENMRPPIMTAFSTASSNATIPVTLTTAEKRLGVDNSVASFTVPLGATINMDGTAIMQGVATVFIANAAGIDLSMTDFLLVILTATFASIGTAGVPGVGMITLAMVLQQVGLPEAGILLLLPVDRILDMCRTAVNICGDAAVTCIVAKGEGQLDEAVFNEPLPAGDEV